jgi:hypothetical protein
MIDEQRNPETTYRVQRSNDLAVFVKSYPKVPSPVADGWYRNDQIPQWLVEAMALLDAAFPEPVLDIGRRLGDNTYWVEAVDSTPAEGAYASLIRDIMLAQKFRDKTATGA